MTLRALSASQAERFDPEQVGGCKRRWFMQDVMRLELPEPEASKEDGHAGHALFAAYFRGETLPNRSRMLKAVRGAIAKGELPAREPGQLVESRFDGQPARDANGERVPLDTTRTLWLGDVPWDGYVDLRFHRAGMITVLDHKFSSDIHTYAKSDLLATVQMPVYALDSLRLWPEAQHVELVHHYVSRKGVDSFLRRQLVTVERVRQRGREIERLVADMLTVSQAKSPEEVPGNRASCHTWSGCPFQSRCTAFKEKPKMNLNPEEMEWLNAMGWGESEREDALIRRGLDEARAADEMARRRAAESNLMGGTAAIATALGAAEKPTNAERAVATLTSIDSATLGAAIEGLSAAEKAKLREFANYPTTGPEAERTTELEIASAGGALSPEDDPFAVFAPKPSVPAEQPARPPSCGDCGAELNTENGSQRDGVWTHVGCPAKSGALTASGPKCTDCPHPAHPGAACTGKRGRGVCRCGAQGPVEKSLDAAALAGGHLPTCVQSDGGKWLCMEGCTASRAAVTAEEVAAAVRGEAPGPLTQKEIVERGADLSASDISAILVRERDMHRRTLGELDASQAGLQAARTELERLRNLEQRVSDDDEGRPVTAFELSQVHQRLDKLTRETALGSGWTGTLQVSVNLGPETLALLTRIFGR